MRIHHLNCGTLCPHGRRFLSGEGGLLETGEVVCHCLLIESEDGLILMDTGFGTDDVERPRQLGPLYRAMRYRPRIGDTARRQVEELGFSAGDVRHIVVTHLDPDHSGGLPDFPQAEVHVFATELEAALHPSLRDRVRYVGSHWRHAPRWAPHQVDGDDWFGFEGVSVLPPGGPEVLLVPVQGHTRGHSAIAVRDGDRWLLHCGDAYFHHAEMESPPSCPPGLRLFQAMTARDLRQRLENRDRLRELAARAGGEVTVLCSHDPDELRREQARSAAVPA